jgi:hypothetical protein
MPVASSKGVDNEAGAANDNQVHSDAQPKLLAVYSIRDTDRGSVWTRCGRARINGDGSMTCLWRRRPSPPGDGYAINLRRHPSTPRDGPSRARHVPKLEAVEFPDPG